MKREALPYLILLAGCALCWRFTVDDAYIYLRLVDGPRLWGNALASYLWATLGIFGVLGFKVAGVLCSVALLRMVRLEAGLAAACLLACYPGVWIGSVAGLETTAAALALFATYRYRERPGLSAVLAVATGLVRLEVGAVAVLLVGLRHWRHAVGAAVALLAYQLVIRALVGPYAPAVYKLGEHHSGLGSTVKAMLALACVLAVPALFHWRRLALRREWIAVACFVAGIAIPRHLADFGWRFTLPVIPLVIALVAPVLRGRAVLVSAAVALSLSWADVRYARAFAEFNADLRGIGEQLHAEGVGRIAVQWAGIVPYFARAESMDLLGYTSTGQPPTVAEMLDFAPDRVLLHAERERRPRWEAFVLREAEYQRALESHGWTMGRSWLLADGRALVEWAR